jgi:hypothetical protein
MLGVRGRALHRGANALGFLPLGRLRGSEPSDGLAFRVIIIEGAKPMGLALLAMNT